MAVFTEISISEANIWLNNYSIGKCVSLEKILGGIENSNYFLTVKEESLNKENTVVLTIFENLGPDKLPYHLGLTEHLSKKKILVPKPFRDKNGQMFSPLKGKPACIVTKLPGKSVIETNVSHCESLGQSLAELHLAAKDFDHIQNNVRSLPWWEEMAPKIKTAATLGKKMNNQSLKLLESELSAQKDFFASKEYAELPAGHCHCDLFRDNVLFSEASDDQFFLQNLTMNEDSTPKETNRKEIITGIFDFYFAGIDKWLFDLAVCVNDWCRNKDNSLDNNRAKALCFAYQRVRPLQKNEIKAWPMMLRTAAYRFWVSRISDVLFPRPACALHAHDPNLFEIILRSNTALGKQAENILLP